MDKDSCDYLAQLPKPSKTPKRWVATSPLRKALHRMPSGPRELENNESSFFNKASKLHIRTEHALQAKRGVESPQLIPRFSKD